MFSGFKRPLDLFVLVAYLSNQENSLKGEFDYAIYISLKLEKQLQGSFHISPINWLCSSREKITNCAQELWKSYLEDLGLGFYNGREKSGKLGG